MVKLEKLTSRQASDKVIEALNQGLELFICDLPWSKVPEKILGIKKFNRRDKQGKYQEYLILPHSIILDFNTSIYRIIVKDIYGKIYPLFSRGIQDELYTLNWFHLNRTDFIRIHPDKVVDGNFLINTKTGKHEGIIRDIFIDTVEHTLDVFIAPEGIFVPLSEPKYIAYSILK